MAERTSSGNPDGAERRTDADLPTLLASARRGEGDAWATLVSLYARRVYAFARSKRLSPDESEEIAQSVFATVSIKVQRGEYDERGSFESWLFQIAANRVRDRLRKAMRADAAMTALRDAADAPGRSTRIDDEHTDETDLRSMRGALADLPDADLEVVQLRHHAGMSFKHIAAMLNQPLGTVLARHHRALRKLRDAIESQRNPTRESDR